MADIDRDDVLQQQAALIASMQTQIQALHQRLPPETAAPVAPGGQFPRAIYKADAKKSGIDHPGYVSKVVGDQAELDAHIAQGWQADAPTAFVYPDPDAELVGAGAGKKTGKK
jgi:hypothetical protein